MRTIRLVARGTYSQPEVPADLARALEAEIQTHMAGYGFTEVVVEVEDWPGAEAAR